MRCATSSGRGRLPRRAGPAPAVARPRDARRAAGGRRALARTLLDRERWGPRETLRRAAAPGGASRRRRALPETPLEFERSLASLAALAPGATAVLTVTDLYVQDCYGAAPPSPERRLGPRRDRRDRGAGLGGGAGPRRPSGAARPITGWAEPQPNRSSFCSGDPGMYAGVRATFDRLFGGLRNAAYTPQRMADETSSDWLVTGRGEALQFTEFRRCSGRSRHIGHVRISRQQGPIPICARVVLSPHQ